MKFTVVIPARYASTRLPGKPLVDIGGKPMIQHVYERGLESGADRVVIATDDDKVAEAAQGFGADVCMTSPDHRSGTERLAEVIDKLAIGANEILVNLQGDEPLMPAALVHQVAENLERYSDAVMATLCERIETVDELFDPNAVKVVMDAEGYAIYFSRATVPWHRDAFAASKEQMPKGGEHYRHIGLYAYRAAFIKQYLAWPSSPLEEAEALEQLRVLWHGKKIHVAQALAKTAPGVDTESDLERVREILANSR